MIAAYVTSGTRADVTLRTVVEQQPLAMCWL